MASTRDRIAAYLDQGLTVSEIARLLAISTQAVYEQIHRHGLSLPNERPDREAS